MTLISTRLSGEMNKELSWYAEKEKVGKTIALRKILEFGMKEIKIQYALDLYSKGKITLMKAGEICGMSIWELLEIIRERKIPMYYTIKDVEKDILARYEKILEKKNGLAIVPITNNVCGGCYMNVPPQTVNELRMHDKVVICELCARLLFLEGDL